MNKILKNVLIFEVILTLTCYFICSFIGLSFNPNDWEKDLREATATFWVGTQLLIIIKIDKTKQQ